MWKLLQTHIKPVRLALVLLAAYAIYRAGYSAGDGYYLQH